ncbi:MAG: efflux RND transporter permease subunit, partial [Kangiellaceae bacterium]|nr:efflux RND transporter permease subunit [Kangiellaceae bacterium]
DQALTVTFSLVMSLVVSSTLIPMFASLGKRHQNIALKSETDTSSVVNKSEKPEKKRNSKFSHVSAGSNSLGRFSSGYEKVLRATLKFKWISLLSAFGIFFLSLMLVARIPTELIPQLSEGEFYFDVSLPEGTALPTTNKLLQQMEREALQHKDVASVYVSVGSRNVSGGLSLKTKDENLAQISIVIKDRADSEMEQRVIDELRMVYNQIPQADIRFARPSFFSLKTPMELLFFGEDLEGMRDYTLALLPKISQVEGLIDVRASLETGNPELVVKFDRDQLARLGFNIESVSETLNRRVNGIIVSRFQQPDRQIDIRLRNREVDRNSVNDMENIVIGEIEGRPVTLRAVASIESLQGPAAIDRISQSRVAILAGNLKGRSLSQVTEDIRQLLIDYPPPDTLSFEFGGQNKEMQQSFNSLYFAIGLAIFLVYLVMAATFEHLGHPFIILLTIPLSLVGVIIGLLSSGYGISVISMIGVVFLVGVVVNNAIVLVDAINHARREGLEKFEAIVTASKSRLRPILMTTFTTVLGLLPMAIGFGEGAELRAPLAVVVSFGLVVATGLTLLIIPACYLIMPSKVTTDDELNRLNREIQDAEHALVSDDA